MFRSIVSLLQKMHYKAKGSSGFFKDCTRGNSVSFIVSEMQIAVEKGHFSVYKSTVFFSLAWL